MTKLSAMAIATVLVSLAFHWFVVRVGPTNHGSKWSDESGSMGDGNSYSCIILFMRLNTLWPNTQSVQRLKSVKSVLQEVFKEFIFSRVVSQGALAKLFIFHSVCECFVWQHTKMILESYSNDRMLIL